MYYGQTISPTGRLGTPQEALLTHASFMPKGLVNAAVMTAGRLSSAEQPGLRILPPVGPNDSVDGARGPRSRVSSHDRHNPRLTPARVAR